MSKELELFRQIIKGYTEMFNMAIHHPKDTIVKWEGVEEIEKALKALEIIKKHIKMVNGQFIFKGISYKKNIKEYDLLKEVLLWD